MRSKMSTAARPVDVPSRPTPGSNVPVWNILSVLASAIMAVALAVGLVAWPGVTPASAIEKGFDFELEGENTRDIIQVQSNRETVCTGNVMGPDLILTAAHCWLLGTSMTILSGSQIRGQGTRHGVSKIGERGDLLLLRVETDAPIDMAGGAYSEIAKNEPPAVGTYLNSYGFGRTCIDCPLSSRLQGTTTEVFDTKNSLRDARNGLAYGVNTLDGSRIWPGDSGGPSFYRAGNKRVLFGIASRVEDDLIVGEPQPDWMSATYDSPGCDLTNQLQCVHQWLIGNGVKEYVPARVHDEFKRDIYVGT
ncbi:trypsin-like serine protease, partial [Streptomyces zaomyceticus]|uniref:trypsin-like serine protease n=1 Tax=Streptomyces zaomyceticus TaxID=68286 RepID=UPI0036999F2A